MTSPIDAARRGEIEAALWRVFASYKLTVPEAARFMDDLLDIIEAFAAGDSERVRYLRRDLLHRDSAPLRAGRSVVVPPDPGKPPEDAGSAPQGQQTFLYDNSGGDDHAEP